MPDSLFKIMYRKGMNSPDCPEAQTYLLYLDARNSSIFFSGPLNHEALLILYLLVSATLSTPGEMSNVGSKERLQVLLLDCYIKSHKKQERSTVLYV
jgi:hypothetical protein